MATLLGKFKNKIPKRETPLTPQQFGTYSDVLDYCKEKSMFSHVICLPRLLQHFDIDYDMDAEIEEDTLASSSLVYKEKQRKWLIRIAKNQSEQKKRMGLAVQLANYILFRRISDLFLTCAYFPTTYDLQEFRAVQFAVNLLIPHEKLVEYLRKRKEENNLPSMDDIANYFYVPVQAARLAIRTASRRCDQKNEAREQKNTNLTSNPNY